MGPLELSLKMRAQEIHSRLRNTQPPMRIEISDEVPKLKALIEILKEELAKAKAAIEVMQPKYRPHTVHRIIDLVCKTEKISRTELTSERRNRYLSRARHIGYFLAATTTPNSLPQIGKYFGGRDHTTIMHGRDRIKILRETDPLLNAKLDWYETELGCGLDKRGA